MRNIRKVPGQGDTICKELNCRLLMAMAPVLCLERFPLTSSAACFSPSRPRRSVVLQCSFTSALSNGVHLRSLSIRRPRSPESVVQPRPAHYRRLPRSLLEPWQNAHRYFFARASPDDDAQPENEVDTALKWMRDFALANFVPLALLTGVSAGLIYPRPGQIAQEWGLSRLSTSGIFLISGLTLKTGDMLQAASAWPAMLFGMVSILFITPLAAIPILHFRLTPKELTTGLAIFCCVPTTLSSGVALSQLAGANTALALALTVSTNLLGIISLPFMLSSLVGRNIGISLPAGSLLKSLVESLLVPLLLGKLIRELSGFVVFLDENKAYLSMISSSLLALVPWMQSSCARDMLLQVDPRQLLAAITLGVVLHVVYVLWNSGVMWFLPAYWGSKGGSQVAAARAVILVASQKTLPVIVAVVSNLNGVLGEAGLLVLPCIATHLSQIIFDSVLVSYWLGSDDAANIHSA